MAVEMATAILSIAAHPRYAHSSTAAVQHQNFASKFWSWHYRNDESNTPEQLPSRERGTRRPSSRQHIDSVIRAKLILDILARARNTDEAKSALEENVQCPLSRQVVGKVFDNLEDADKAVAFFDWAESLSWYRHSTYACNGLLSVLVRSERLLEALEFYRNRLLGKYSLNQVSYGILIQGFCKAGNLQQAVALLDEMKRKGVQPNIVVHTTIIRGLCSTGKVSQALIHFRKIREECCPNVFTYSVLVDALCKSRQPGEAYELVAEMARKGCPPNVVTYNALIDGFRKVGKLDDILVILKEMRERGCNPDVVTYSMLVDTFCNTDSDHNAYLLLEVMREAGCEPNKVTYNTIFGKTSPGRICDAITLLEKMIQQGTRPDADNYRTLLLTLCRNQRLDEAYQVLLSMLSRGCLPDQVTYKILIVAFASAGRTYQSLEVLKRMLERGYVLDTKTMNVTIDKFCKAGDIDEAYQLFKSICQRGSVASEVTYNTLIFASCKAGRPDSAARLLEQMNQAGFRPDSIVYNAVIGAFCRAEKQEAAFGVFLQMLDDGCFPNDITYNTLKISRNQAAQYRERVLAIRCGGMVEQPRKLLIGDG